MNPSDSFSQRRDLYLANASEAISKGEYSKASEMLWGAVTQEIKKLAAYKGIRITTHGEFFEFMRAVSKQVGDHSLYEAFATLNVLHSNFYDPAFPDVDFPGYHQKALDFLKRLEALLIDQVREEGRQHGGQ